MSPRRHADETLPQRFAGSELEGCHRVERVLELGGAVVSVLDRLDREDVRLLPLRRVITLPLMVYEGTWTILSPLVAIHHHDLACA